MANKLTSLTGFGEGDPKPEKRDSVPYVLKFSKNAKTKSRYSPDSWDGHDTSLKTHQAKSKALSKKSGDKPKFKWDWEHPKGEGGAIRERQDAKWKEVMSRGKRIWPKE